MSTIVLFAVCGLATFRLAEAVVFDDGPFEMLINLRGWLFASPENQPLRRALSDVTACIHCAGFWIALPMIFMVRATSILEFFVFWFAVAGIQSVLSTAFGRSR